MFGHIGYLPPTLVNKPHVIVQNTVLFNVIQYFGRRGKEGIEDMKVGEEYQWFVHSRGQGKIASFL